MSGSITREQVPFLWNFLMAMRLVVVPDNENLTLFSRLALLVCLVCQTGQTSTLEIPEGDTDKNDGSCLQLVEDMLQRLKKLTFKYPMLLR